MSDEEMFAAMQALKNPEWWQNMMILGKYQLFLFQAR
jgi:hypothetical protein